jgi:hypothetical protein
MNWRVALTMFGVIFPAEMGDKTMNLTGNYYADNTN